MALEPSVVNLSDLNPAWPLGNDSASISDDNHRNIKTALLNDFAGFTGAVLVTGVDGGAADAYTLTPAHAVVAYTAKMLILFTPVATNITTTPTINISGLGAKSLKDVAGNAPLAGDFVINRPYLGEYDGTNVRMMAITKNYADQLAMTAALPAQPGGTARYQLASTLGVAQWTLESMNVRSISGASTVTVADAGNLVECTAGGFTLAFDPVATLGDNTSGYLMNTGTGVSAVTLDPSGAETIDGLASFVMYAGEIRRWYVDGAGIRTLKLKNYYISTNTSFTHIQPPGYSDIDLDLVGASGGAGSGCRGAAGTARPGGGAGGSPARVQRKINGIAPGTSTTVTVGAAGTSGASITTNSTNGADGTAGGNTSFGSYVTAFGGAKGFGGIIGNDNPATSGSGSISAGSSNATGGALPGGYPRTDSLGNNTATTSNNIGEGGGGTFSNGGNTDFGGAGAPVNSNVGLSVFDGPSSIRGVPASTIGGWIRTTNDMPTAAGNAGSRNAYIAGGGATGGTCGASPTAGGNGAAAAGDYEVGGSGAGGGSSITAAAGKGGDGGYPGGAPGGGGASVNGQASGAGGAAASGRAIVKGA